MTDIIVTIRRAGEDPDEAATVRYNEREHSALANILDHTSDMLTDDLDMIGRYVLESISNTLMAARRPAEQTQEDSSAEDTD